MKSQTDITFGREDIFGCNACRIEMTKKIFSDMREMLQPEVIMGYVVTDRKATVLLQLLETDGPVKTFVFDE